MSPPAGSTTIEVVNSNELEHQMERVFHDLLRDLGHDFPHERVVLVGRAHYESLRRDAVVNDYIPLLVYRLAKEELRSGARDELHDAA